MAAYELLVKNPCVREFLDKPVPKEIIEKIIYAGHRAATARNLQPWIFVAVTEAESRKNIKNLCPKNGPYIEFAPVCICVFCENTSYYLEDGSAATQNIINAAHSFGLGSVWVAGDKKDYADAIRKYLNVPEKYKLISLVPVGYPKTPLTLTPKKPMSEVLFWGKYE